MLVANGNMIMTPFSVLMLLTSCTLQNKRLGWPSRLKASSSSSLEGEDEEEEEEEEEGEDEMVARGQFRQRSARKSEEDEAAASLGKRSSRRCGRGSGRRAGGDEVASGATPAAEEKEEEGDRPKYGFRDRRTLKRTQFFTYDKVLNIILFLTTNSVVARQKILPELGEPNHGMGCYNTVII